MLNPAQDIHQLSEPQGARGFLSARHRGQPDEGIQLVNGTVGLDSQGILGDALAARQAGFALVATLGVDPVERDPGIVKRAVGHVFMVFAVDPYALRSMITGGYSERLSPEMRNARPFLNLLPPRARAAKPKGT